MQMRSQGGGKERGAETKKPGGQTGTERYERTDAVGENRDTPVNPRERDEDRGKASEYSQIHFLAPRRPLEKDGRFRKEQREQPGAMRERRHRP